MATASIPALCRFGQTLVVTGQTLGLALIGHMHHHAPVLVADDRDVLVPAFEGGLIDTDRPRRLS
jgi:hypothetical protein